MVILLLKVIAGFTGSQEIFVPPSQSSFSILLSSVQCFGNVGKNQWQIQGSKDTRYVSSYEPNDFRGIFPHILQIVGLVPLRIAGFPLLSMCWPPPVYEILDPPLPCSSRSGTWVAFLPIAYVIFFRHRMITHRQIATDRFTPFHAPHRKYPA